MSSSLRFLLLVAAVAGVSAFAAPAFAADANMDEIWDGQKMRGEVIYDAAAVETNDVTISMQSPTRLVITDPGAFIWAGWGLGMGYGCRFGGQFPVLCEHPNGFALVDVTLGDGDDSLEVASSVASSVVTAVDSDLLIVRGGQTLFVNYSGSDQIDVRGGAAGDHVICGRGADVAVTDMDDVAAGCETRLFEESLGGQLASGAAVASWGSGRLDVFWRGTDNTLQHRWFDGGWGGPESLGGQLTSDPAAVSWGPGRIDVFWRGTDGTLQHKWYAEMWSGTESLGGQLAPGSGPAAASWGRNRLDVVWRGPDNDLRHRWFDGSWRAEESLAGELASDPAAVSWGPDRLDIFWRGTGNDLRHRWYDHGWRPAESLGGVLTSGPGVASDGADRLDVFVFGADRALYRRTYNAGWSNWERLGGRRRPAPSDPEAVSWGPGRVDIFMRGYDNALRHLWRP